MKHTTPTFKEIEKEIDYWTSVEDKKYMFVKKSTIKSFIRKHIIKIMERERKELKQNIGLLRQWLNEDRIDNPKKFITNEMIEIWFIKKIK